MTEKTKIKKQTTSVVLDNIPQNYIKAKYLRHNTRVTQMAGFEAGEGEVKIITTRGGKRQMRLTLNGMTQIEANGDCLILDTLFNRQKLQILCQDMTERMPKDSTGKEFKVINKGPDFSVEDESIFDGLDEVAEAAENSKKTIEKAGKAVKLPKGKGIVPAPKGKEGEKPDNAEGVGGGDRRPEMADGMDLDIDA